MLPPLSTLLGYCPQHSPQCSNITLCLLHLLKPLCAATLCWPLTWSGERWSAACCVAAISMIVVPNSSSVISSVTRGSPNRATWVHKRVMVGCQRSLVHERKRYWCNLVCRN